MAQSEDSEKTQLLSSTSSSDQGTLIHVINKTKTPHTVLMFGLHHSTPLSLIEVEMAWQIIDLGPRGNVSVLYPDETAVGAYYTKSDGSIVTLGPFVSQPGSKWIVEMETVDNDGILSQDGEFIPP